MKKFWVRINTETIRFWKDTKGQDLVEYALIVAAIALVLIATVQGLAAALNTIYVNITTRLSELS